jgi:hypothetical protein
MVFPGHLLRSRAQPEVDDDEHSYTDGDHASGTTFTDATPDTNSGLGIEGGNQGVLLGSSSEAGGVSWLASMATGDVSATPDPVVASVHLVAPLVTALLCLHMQLFGKGM